MPNIPDEHTPSLDSDSYRVQLAEFNSRSRFYATQIWQLPLAYLAGVGIVLAGLRETALIVGLGSAGVAGALLRFHLRGLEDGRRRSVIAIQDVEDRLGVSRAADGERYTLERPGYTRPLHILVTLASIGFFLAALLLLLET